MANKTRAEIKSLIYYYMPQMNQTAKVDLLNAAIDLAVERISNLWDFRSLRSVTYDEYTVSAGEYTVSLDPAATPATFAVMLADSFKHITAMYRRRQSESDYSPIRFIDDKIYHDKFGYVDDPSRDGGYPEFYTVLGDMILLNCKASEDIILRAWWQRYHPAFTDDNMSHEFDRRDNMVAYFAIAYQAMVELKNSLNCLEVTQDLTDATMLAERYTHELITRDKEREMLNEDGELLGWAEREDFPIIDTDDPYSWVS